jgi:cell division transport system permease protein
MALKVDYVVKETGRNLVRNPLLSLATIVVVVVAVALVGGSLLIRQAVGNATERWQGGIEFIVYMNPNASPEQIDAVNRALDEAPNVDTFTYLDKDAAFAEYRELFEEDSPELVDAVTPEALPTSFKVKPDDPAPEVVDGLVQQFTGQSGVYKVVAATDAIRSIERISNIMSAGIALVALCLTVAALLFIGFTIQTAVFSRRREIEVMKLVGATNWFIRVPFMLEGIIQGVLGALLGILGVYGLDRFLDRVVAGDDGLGIFTNFAVASGDVFSTATALFIGAVIITAIASAIAVSFYVNV